MSSERYQKQMKETVRTETAEMGSERECQLIEHFNPGRAAHSCSKTLYLWFILFSVDSPDIIRKKKKNKLSSKLGISKVVCELFFVKVYSLSH